MSLPENVIRALRNEKGQIDEMVAKLSDRSSLISKLLRSEGSQPSRISPKPADRVTCLSSAPSVAKTCNTQLMVYMARIVIQNAGRPLAAQAIPEKIRSTFGIVAAKGLPRMLIKRARRSKSGFYLSSDGLIGQIEAAAISSTSRA